MKYKVTVECSETFTVEAPNREAAENKAIEMACIEGIWTSESECIDWPENIKDLNRNEVKIKDKFRFKGCDHIFVLLGYDSGNRFGAVLDLTDYYCYDLETIWEWGFPETLDAEWYRKENDEDFYGVEVIGKMGE